MAGDAARDEEALHLFAEQRAGRFLSGGLAWLKCQRYFVERAIQDAKSEVGWDELQARKYRDDVPGVWTQVHALAVGRHGPAARIATHEIVRTASIFPTSSDITA